MSFIVKKKTINLTNRFFLSDVSLCNLFADTSADTRWHFPVNEVIHAGDILTQVVVVSVKVRLSAKTPVSRKSGLKYSRCF